MKAFDPVLNSESILHGLRLIQIIKHKEVQLAHSANHMIVVFSVEPNEFEAGRIHLFQDYVYENTGLLLSASKWMNACIKVFFDIDGITPEEKLRLSKLFSSPSFSHVAVDLDISHVQLDRIYWPT